MTDEERLADIVSRVDMGLGDGRGDAADTMWLISKVRELEADKRRLDWLDAGWAANRAWIDASMAKQEAKSAKARQRAEITAGNGPSLHQSDHDKR